MAITLEKGNYVHAQTILNFALGGSLPPVASHALRIGIILGLLALSVALVHTTDGAGGAYTYIMLLPILVGVYAYSLIGGLATPSSTVRADKPLILRARGAQTGTTARRLLAA